jgi:LysM repeat protein
VSIGRREVARVGAPVAFLLGVTAAVLLVRAGLEAPGRTSTLGPVSQASTAAVPKTTKTVTHAHTGTAAGTRYYTIQKGDTFGSVAAKEGTSAAALEELNPGVSPTSLRVGQKIRVK